MFVALNFGCFRTNVGSKLSTRYLLLEKSSSSNITCVSEICLLFTSQWFENLAHLAIWVVNEAMNPMWQKWSTLWLRTARQEESKTTYHPYLVMGPASYCTESTPKKEPHYILISQQMNSTNKRFKNVFLKPILPSRKNAQNRRD